jgi:transcriptional regulator with XRE-family HTH domain
MNWLKIFRVAAGLTQAELSKRVGMSQQYYSRLETGMVGQRLSVLAAKRIAAVLDFPWSRFYDEAPSQTGDIESRAQP